MSEVRIDEVFVSRRVLTKCASKHGLTEDELEEAITLRREKTTWTTNHEGEPRVTVTGRTFGGSQVLAILCPTEEEGCFHLATAFRYP